MAIVKKISELTPKGSALANTDLLIVGVDNGTDYDLKSVTGAQVLGNVVSQTITGGVTTKSPSEDAIFEKLKDYDTLSTSQNSSTAIRFDKKFIHCGTDISGKFIGLTGNISILTGVGTLNVNTSSLLIHNDIIAPTFSSEFIKSQDSLDYKINVDNYVICSLINQNPFKVSYRIVRDINDSRLITNAEATILSNTSGTNTGDQDLSNLVVKNTSITGATKTKITYDSKGLITSGTDATTVDIADSLDKRYVTDANLTTIGNTSGTNTGDETVSTIKTKLGITTLSGSNTGDQDLSNLATKSTPTFTGLATLDTLKVTTGNYITPVDVVGIDVTGNVNRVSAANARTVLGLGSLATQNGTFSGTSSGTNTGDQTFLNARVQSVTSSATVTPTNLNDLVIITAQAVGLTLANPTGTFTEGQALMIRIKDNGTARTIAFDTNYRAIGVTLPTTTVISKTLYLGIIYNSTDTKWDIVGYNIQA